MDDVYICELPHLSAAVSVSARTD